GTLHDLALLAEDYILLRSRESCLAISSSATCLIVRPLVSVSRTASFLKSAMKMRRSPLPMGPPVASNANRKSLHISGKSRIAGHVGADARTDLWPPSSGLAKIGGRDPGFL